MISKSLAGRGGRRRTGLSALAVIRCSSFLPVDGWGLDPTAGAGLIDGFCAGGQNELSLDTSGASMRQQRQAHG